VGAMEVASSPEEMNLASWRLQEITKELERLVGQSKIPGACGCVWACPVWLGGRA
jgi:hypothetical protein